MTPSCRMARREARTRPQLAGIPPLVTIPAVGPAGSHAPSPRPTTADLRATLEQALSRHFGERRRIATLKRRLSPYRSSFNLEELDVELDDGLYLELIFKDLSRWAMLKEAQRARPEFLYEPSREIQTYRMILARHQLGTATCYGAVMDEASGREWLFLERVPGMELRHVGEFATWQQAARWLADLHTLFARATKPLGQASELHLLRHDADYYRVWMRRAQAFAQPAKRTGKRKPVKGIDRLASRYEEVVRRLVSLPGTLIHGEFYACNVWVRSLGRERRVCPVDWEMAAIGPGLIDLASLCAGWSDRRRSALALTYYHALRPHHGWPPKLDEFFVALDCCQLHLAVRMLGWSSTWSAPPQHAYDWLKEAVRLAERLGL